MSDFWESLISGHAVGKKSSMDDHVGPNKRASSIRSVVANSDTPLPEGTRVRFSSDLSANMTYEASPKPSEQGTVVARPTSLGVVTGHHGKVFVAWDTSGEIPVFSSHLEDEIETQDEEFPEYFEGDPTTKLGRIDPRIRKIKASGLGDLSSFLKVSSSALIHKSTKDLWSFSAGDDGLVVERLFDDNGKPLKG